MCNKVLFPICSILTGSVIAFGATQFQAESTSIKENNRNTSIAGGVGE